MNEEDLVIRLSNLGIRPTAVRLMIGRLLDASDHPVSSLEIETELDTVDRSTITRTLTLVLEKGLVHLIEDGSGASKYESCMAPHGREQDSDRHVHFHCRVCGNTLCLHSNPIPEIVLPSGFTQESANFTLTGICDRCSGKQSFQSN